MKQSTSDIAASRIAEAKEMQKIEDKEVKAIERKEAADTAFTNKTIEEQTKEVVKDEAQVLEALGMNVYMTGNGLFYRGKTAKDKGDMNE